MRRHEERDHELLETLNKKVRVLSLEQIRRTWWNETSRLVDIRTRLSRYPLVFRPTQLSFVPVQKPLLSWSPDEPEFVNWDGLAHKLKKRWKNPRLGVVTYLEDRRAPRNSELLHDVHVGEIYLRHFFRDRSDAWEHEDRLTSSKGERPDAIVRFGAPDGTDLLIDFGGRYAAPKLRRKHAAFKQSYYEIW